MSPVEGEAARWAASGLTGEGWRSVAKKPLFFPLLLVAVLVWPCACDLLGLRRGTSSTGDGALSDSEEEE
jgi:hypothetical protein